MAITVIHLLSLPKDVCLFLDDLIVASEPFFGIGNFLV